MVEVPPAAVAMVTVAVASPIVRICVVFVDVGSVASACINRTAIAVTMPSVMRVAISVGTDLTGMRRRMAGCVAANGSSSMNGADCGTRMMSRRRSRAVTNRSVGGQS
jgi:hypothetical protein